MVCDDRCWSFGFRWFLDLKLRVDCVGFYWLASGVCDFVAFWFCVGGVAVFWSFAVFLGLGRLVVLEFLGFGLNRLLFGLDEVPFGFDAWVWCFLIVVFGLGCCFCVSLWVWIADWVFVGN